MEFRNIFPLSLTQSPSKGCPSPSLLLLPSVWYQDRLFSFTNLRVRVSGFHFLSVSFSLHPSHTLPHSSHTPHILFQTLGVCEPPSILDGFTWQYLRLCMQIALKKLTLVSFHCHNKDGHSHYWKQFPTHTDCRLIFFIYWTIITG